MKVGKYRAFALVTGILVVATSFLSVVNPTPAYAAGEQYTFYYKNDDINKIKSTLQAPTDSAFSTANNNMGLAAVYVREGVFRQLDKPLQLKYNASASRVSKRHIYSVTYSCTGTPDNKISIPAKESDRYSMAFDVSMSDSDGKNSLPFNFDQTVGQGYVAQASIVAKTNATGTALQNPPAGCAPALAQVRPSNFAKLSSSAKSNWGDLKTSQESDAAGAGVDPDATPEGASADEVGCTASGGFGWIICGAIYYINEAVTWVERDVIEPFMEIDPLTFNTGDTNPLYKAWDSLRGLANIFFVLIFIGIMLANTFGIQAYNVKKMLPRLIVAAILVQASYLIVALAFDISNVLGGGMRALINPYVPDIVLDNGTVENATTIGAGSLITILLGAKFLAAGAITALTPLFIGILGTLFTLVLLDVARNLVLLLAPLAMVAMVLPGTQNYFRKWANALVIIVMMPPIIVLLFMVGKFTAFAAASTGPLGPIIAILCLAMTLLVVPFSVSLAKGAVGQIGKLGVARANSMGKSFEGSQYNKNRIQNRQERAAMKYSNAPVGGFKGATFGNYSRAKARVLTGNALSGTDGARRLATTYNSTVKDRANALNQQLTNLTPAQQKTVLGQLANGDGARGFNQDPATQVAAIQRLLQTRDYDRIRGLDSKVKNSQAWRTATQPHMGDIMKEAPDIGLNDNFASVASATPTALADMHQSTLSGAINNASVAPQLLPSLQQLSSNPALRAKIKSDTALELLAHQSKFQNVNVSVADIDVSTGKQKIVGGKKVFKTIKGDEYIRDHLVGTNTYTDPHTGATTTTGHIQPPIT